MFYKGKFGVRVLLAAGFHKFFKKFRKFFKTEVSKST